jgi:hypothetical protein
MDSKKDTETTYIYTLPDGSDDTPDEHGNHTATVNVWHSAAQAERFPGCESCRSLAQTSCPVCFNIPAMSAYGGWDEATETFATAVNHGDRGGCGNPSCELCAKYAAGWCQTCEQFTREAS